MTTIKIKMTGGDDKDIRRYYLSINGQNMGLIAERWAKDFIKKYDHVKPVGDRSVKEWTFENP